MCRKARQHKPLVSNRGVQIDRQQPNNRAESHGTQGILSYPACVNKALKVDIRFFRQEVFSLNEETWVQDIKEKREVYGISQQKLALAAGITRPYLSDIETGKKPYGFLKSVLAYLVRPKLTYAGKPVKLEKEYPAQPITAVRSDIYGISD